VRVLTSQVRQLPKAKGNYPRREVVVWLAASGPSIYEMGLQQSGSNLDVDITQQIFFIHMCIQCLGHFSPPPSLIPATPRYQAETSLPLSLILLKREYK
jgi:hypothetical protein